METNITHGLLLFQQAREQMERLSVFLEVRGECPVRQQPGSFRWFEEKLLQRINENTEELVGLMDAFRLYMKSWHQCDKSFCEEAIKMIESYERRAIIDTKHGTCEQKK